MRVMRAAYIALIAFALLACGPRSVPGSGAGDAAPTRETGASSMAIISGTVSRGPITPNQPAGKPATAPVAGGRIEISTADGAPVTSAETDAQGNFRITVAPGTYKIATPGLRARNLPPAVTVSAGEEKHLDIAIDTGLY